MGPLISEGNLGWCKKNSIWPDTCSTSFFLTSGCLKLHVFHVSESLNCLIRRGRFRAREPNETVKGLLWEWKVEDVSGRGVFPTQRRTRKNRDSDTVDGWKKSGKKPS